MFELTGRVALVTGAGRGVGAGIARRLAEQGAVVAVNDISEARAEQTVAALVAQGARATPAVADVTDRSSVLAAIEKVSSELGPVEVLVNNAGVPPIGFRVAPFVDTEPPDWDMSLQINLYGVMYCTHAVLPPMLQQRWGRVITVVSDAGRFGEANMAAYAAAKAGAAGFMRAIAKEVGRNGVTCNAISLGSMEQPDPDSDPTREQRAQRYPTKRLGRPDDAASAVVWLASDEASWVTGQTMSINGGLNAT